MTGETGREEWEGTERETENENLNKNGKRNCKQRNGKIVSEIA